jgi:hypothetical protein
MPAQGSELRLTTPPKLAEFAQHGSLTANRLSKELLAMQVSSDPA